MIQKGKCYTAHQLFIRILYTLHRFCLPQQPLVLVLEDTRIQKKNKEENFGNLKKKKSFPLFISVYKY